MKIIERKPGVYLLVWELGRDPETRKRKQKSETFRGEREDAEHRWHVVQATIEEGQLSAQSRLLLERVAERWNTEILPSRVRLNTMRGYRQVLYSYILPRWGKTAIGDITASDVDRWYRELMRTPGPRTPEGLAPRTVQLTHAVLTQIFKQAVRWRYIAWSPMEAVTPPSLRPKPMVVWNDEEMGRFWSVAQLDTYAPIFYVALMTGMRQEEILSLKWSDWTSDGLDIKRVLVWNKARRVWVEELPKTKQSARLVPIDEDTAALLAQQKERTQAMAAQYGWKWSENTWMFPTRSGKPVNARNMVAHYYEARNKAGVPPLTFHDLRHTHASWLIRKGASPKMVAERLGHARIAFTLDRYVHLTPKDQESWVQELQDTMRRVTPKADPPTEESTH